MSYLLQENGDKIALEDGTGFLLLEDGTVIVVTGRFDAPSPSGASGTGSPLSDLFRASPSADVFDPPSPEVTNA